MVDRGSKSEDEWFRLNEQELLETARQARLKREQERAAKEKAEETKRLKDLHFMKCPKCGMDLQTVKHGDVDMETCFNCHGIFLDAGELQRLQKQLAHENSGKWMGAVLNLFKNK